ncbi:hypothetical protein LLEC1_07061 [Akanthomyces lecanii]|uniref:Uncharacterized protein n=1 Tax=Cordyceps confragosa TaxID=2714763 RepID=A0A179I3F3_CORDF|nr:hypothetical protein LLEC1_07061 [Akanthomyces lecanii]
MYYALQRECQASAVLQLMQAALAQRDAPGPILVYPQPWDWVEGHENMLAFSDEWRRKGLPAHCNPDELVEVTSMPRVRKCYGWIKIKGETLFRLRPEWWPPRLKIEKRTRQMERDAEYTALVYEYVEEGENEEAAVEESLKFFREAVESDWCYKYKTILIKGRSQSSRFLSKFLFSK